MLAQTKSRGLLALAWSLLNVALAGPQGYNLRYPSFNHGSMYLDYSDYDTDITTLLSKTKFDRGKYGRKCRIR